jgi:hypothetical protein
MADPGCRRRPGAPSWQQCWFDALGQLSERHRQIVLDNVLQRTARNARHRRAVSAYPRAQPLASALRPRPPAQTAGYPVFFISAP